MRGFSNIHDPSFSHSSDPFHFSLQRYFNEVIQLTEQYIAANLASVDGNAPNLQDTTVLMEVKI